MAAISHVVFALGVMADYPQSAFSRLKSVLKSLVRRINSSGDIGVYRFRRFGLKLPIRAPFGGVFGEYFPIWRHLSPWPPKGPSLGGNTSFEPFSVRIGATVRPGRMSGMTEKNYRTTKKSQKCYISHILGKPPLDRFDPKVVGDVHDVITCAKFQIEIFM